MTCGVCSGRWDRASDLVSRTPGLLQESLGPFGKCPRKLGCSKDCPSRGFSGLQSVQKVSRDCPRVSKRYPGHSAHTLGTLLDTPKPWGPEDTPWDSPSHTPALGDDDSASALGFENLKKLTKLLSEGGDFLKTGLWGPKTGLQI